MNDDHAMPDDAAPHVPPRVPSGILDSMLCFDVYAANLAFGRVYKPLLDPLGLTYSQFLVMLSLWTQDGQSVGRIGENLGLDSSTLTPLIKRLEAAQMVTRKRDTRDERRVIVSLTPDGQAMEARSASVLACVTQATGLSADEQQELRQMLRRLRVGLQQTVD